MRLHLNGLSEWRHVFLRMRDEAHGWPAMPGLDITSAVHRGTAHELADAPPGRFVELELNNGSTRHTDKVLVLACRDLWLTVLEGSGVGAGGGGGASPGRAASAGEEVGGATPSVRGLSSCQMLVSYHAHSGWVPSLRGPHVSRHQEYWLVVEDVPAPVRYSLLRSLFDRLEPGASDIACILLGKEFFTELPEAVLEVTERSAKVANAAAAESGALYTDPLAGVAKLFHDCHRHGVGVATRAHGMVEALHLVAHFPIDRLIFTSDDPPQPAAAAAADAPACLSGLRSGSDRRLRFEQTLGACWACREGGGGTGDTKGARDTGLCVWCGAGFACDAAASCEHHLALLRQTGAKVSEVQGGARRSSSTSMASVGALSAAGSECNPYATYVKYCQLAREVAALQRFAAQQQAAGGDGASEGDAAAAVVASAGAAGGADCVEVATRAEAVHALRTVTGGCVEVFDSVPEHVPQELAFAPGLLAGAGCGGGGGGVVVGPSLGASGAGCGGRLLGLVARFALCHAAVPLHLHAWASEMEGVCRLVTRLNALFAPRTGAAAQGWSYAPTLRAVTAGCLVAERRVSQLLPKRLRRGAGSGSADRAPAAYPVERSTHVRDSVHARAVVLLNATECTQDLSVAAEPGETATFLLTPDATHTEAGSLHLQRLPPHTCEIVLFQGGLHTLDASEEEEEEAAAAATAASSASSPDGLPATPVVLDNIFTALPCVFRMAFDGVALEGAAGDDGLPTAVPVGGDGPEEYVAVGAEAEGMVGVGGGEGSGPATPVGGAGAVSPSEETAEEDDADSGDLLFGDGDGDGDGDCGEEKGEEEQEEEEAEMAANREYAAIRTLVDTVAREEGSRILGDAPVPTEHQVSSLCRNEFVKKEAMKKTVSVLRLLTCGGSGEGGGAEAAAAGGAAGADRVRCALAAHGFVSAARLMAMVSGDAGAAAATAAEVESETKPFTLRVEGFDADLVVSMDDEALQLEEELRELSAEVGVSFDGVVAATAAEVSSTLTERVVPPPSLVSWVRRRLVAARTCGKLLELRDELSERVHARALQILDRGATPLDPQVREMVDRAVRRTVARHARASRRADAPPEERGGGAAAGGGGVGMQRQVTMLHRPDGRRVDAKRRAARDAERQRALAARQHREVMATKRKRASVTR